jgi:hypothetical protein
MISFRPILTTDLSLFSIIRVKLYQAFLMSGGPNGRLSRGDELIEMEFFGLDDGDHEFLEAPTCL